MYPQDHLYRIVNSFKWGFFSDRIVGALTEYENKGRISGEGLGTLEEGISFIDMILSGGKQITDGIQVSNALESLMVYNKSLSIILDMPDLPEPINTKKIQEIFEGLKDNLIQISRGNSISVKKVAKTKSFFNCLREKTLEDSTVIMNGLYESRRSDKWQLALET